MKTESVAWGRAKDALVRKLGTGEILDALPIGVYCCDLEGLLVNYNRHAAELWGRNPELGRTRMGGAYRLLTLSGELLDHAVSPMAEVLKTGIPVRNFRVVIERLDSSRVTVLASVEPLFDEGGAPVGAVSCFQDVTELRRASEELEHSKDDLEDFFENGAVGLHVVGSDGKILRANKAELDMLGYSADEYIGRDIADFHADEPVIGDILNRLGKGEKLDRYPARLRAKDGSIRHVLITSNAQFRDGHFAKTRCFTFDVTEAKMAEERVREGEQRFREVLEAMPVAIYTTDADGKITFYNQAAVELGGRTPEIGTDEWCVTWRLYWPDGTPLPHDECPMAVTLKEGKPIRGAEAVAERPDGSRVRFAPYPTPLFDQNGKLTGAVNMLLDITERHEADLQSARLAAIVGSSDDAILSNTLAGRVLTWNSGAERMFGYKAAEIVGKSLKTIIPPDLHAEEDEILARVERGERIEHFDTQRVAKDGRLIDISLSVSPVPDRLGNMVAASRVARDITKRKEAERLQQLLIAELSHRVKNTLATVQSIANQTVRLAKSPGDFAASFGGRLQALARAHTLLTHTTWQGADLLALVRDHLLLEGSEDTRVEYGGPSVTLDPQASLHVALVLHELATNARKYGALSVPEGRVSVAWVMRAQDGQTLRLEWKERAGPKVSAPRTRGFGTTLIEQSLHAQGGEARIDYEADGITCSITLPVANDAHLRTGAYGRVIDFGKASGALEAPPSQSALHGKRILVVDDEPLIAMEIVSNLREAGCEVVGPAATLERAMPLIGNDAFDAALLDGNLGGRPVDELAAALTRRNIPFAFITGYGRDGLPKAFKHAMLISKPFNRQQLLAALSQLLQQHADVISLRHKNS